MIGNPKTERTIMNKVFNDENSSLNISDLSLEVVKMNAQVCDSDGIGIATNVYNGVLLVNDVLPSDVDGEDYIEDKKTVTVAGGATDSGSGSVSEIYVLVDDVKRIKGNVMAVVKYYIESSSASGTITISGLNVEVGIVNEDGVLTALASKSKTLSISTSSSLSGSLCLFLGRVDYVLGDGERIYVKIEMDYSYEIVNTGTASIDVTVTARILNSRGVSETYVRVPIGMM